VSPLQIRGIESLEGYIVSLQRSFVRRDKGVANSKARRSRRPNEVGDETKSNKVLRRSLAKELDYRSLILLQTRVKFEIRQQ
jgi:hypothetical protein